ncbi:XRE family transcriptional regulator [Pseudoflavonifractor sp. 60]|uniref:helix-turn-helix domain-containing protein n=1 Tax=Pseudoflavonifractor sp. 60 TaxID=2304576 RepID=UPI0013697839|nr:helix-turn-helix transcriptional regulator [Pseudoflavonifractor sp. 60]NBI66611.1 XRE family transcriptional regulator [Pseudoflavonifractor sp. 60]
MLDYQEIGKNIKLYRIQRNMKQAALAERIDVSTQYISHIECGSTSVGLKTLVKIAAALSVSVDMLLGTNLPIQADNSIAPELTSLLQDAAPEDRNLCLALCRAVIEEKQRAYFI